MTPIEQAAHEPGIGKVDYVCRNAQDEIVPCGSEGASEPEPMLSHYHGDQIGSTRAITCPGSAGVPPASIQGRIVYTAFGERVWSDGTVGTRYQYAGSWGYQSELYEDASGNLPFVHVGHRWYDPATGRFLQRDPIGIRGEVNVYRYVGSRPIQSIDPSGLGGFITGGGTQGRIRDTCDHINGPPPWGNKDYDYTQNRFGWGSSPDPAPKPKPDMTIQEETRLTDKIIHGSAAGCFFISGCTLWCPPIAAGFGAGGAAIEFIYWVWVY